MTTKPHHDAQSIATDAKRVLSAAHADLSDKRFAKYVNKHELDVFGANVAALESGDGARSVTLHAQVAAGVHAAKARGPVVHLLRDVRDDAKLRFPHDLALQHAFGVGAIANAASTSSVEHAAHQLLAAAEAHAKEAASVGLDTKVVHHLEDLLHALEGAELAHVQAASDRHESTTTTDSVAHAVSAETAHLRLVAHRVFRDEPNKLDRYARTLARHPVKPRAKVATPPAGGATA